MLELFYPDQPVQEIPYVIVRAGDSQARNKEEMLPVVDRCGRVEAYMGRSYAHSGAKVLHPVVHLHIINRRGELYLQKRAMNKKLLPGRWDTAVGGHVSFGESVWEALWREAWEELRLSDFNPVFIEDYVFESDIERELVCVFAAVGDFNISPDNEEVSEGRFWSMDEIEDTIGKDVLTPNFEGEFLKFKTTLQSLL